MIKCVLKRILHKKKSIFVQFLESCISPLTAAALRMIICKRPATHFDNHEKGMKNAFLRPFTMSIKESNFTEKMDQNFHICYGQGRGGSWPLTVRLTLKYPFFTPLILNIEILSSTHMTIKMSDFAILAMFLFSFYKAHLYIQNLKRALLQNISTFVKRFISISEMIDMTSTKAYPDKIKYTSVLPKYNTT